MAKEEFLKPFRLAEILRLEVVELEEHQPIPTERQLAERFGVSRVSVRQALSLLNKDGVIYTVHGSGSFAAPPRSTKQMKLLSFSQEMLMRGLKPSTQLLSLELINSTEAEARDLIEISQPTFRIERLRFGNKQPMSWEVSYIAQSKAPNLTKKDLSGSLYQVLKDKFDQEIVSADEQVSPVLIDKALSSKLETATGKPALELVRHSFNNRGEQVELSRTIRRGDLWDLRYTVRI
jgi:GntR family transcriptional regulator